VGVRWYAVALLTAPLLWTAILFALSLTSTAFLPAIITADDKTSLLVAGLVVGLVASFFEELGWTGFATPEIRKRHGLLATGLIVGLPWFVWHLPLYAGSASSSGAVSPALYVAVILFSWLPPYGCSWCGSTTIPRACSWRCSCTCRSTLTRFSSPLRRG
jgi:uncharacterized protein